MNTFKKTKLHIFQFAVLLISFFTFVIKADGQGQPGNDPATKEIIRAMNNSAKEWNEGKLDAFIDLYDPTATMMSHCLFPNTAKRCENPLAGRLDRNRARWGSISEKSVWNAG